MYVCMRKRARIRERVRACVCVSMRVPILLYASHPYYRDLCITEQVLRIPELDNSFIAL